MAIPEVIAEQQGLVGINADYKEKFGFHDPESGSRSRPRRASRVSWSSRSPSSRTSRSGCASSA